MQRTEELTAIASKPRIWPTLVALFVVPLLTFVVGGAIYALYGRVAAGLSVQELSEPTASIVPMLSTPGGAAATLLPGMLTFALGALALGLLSREPLRSRIRWRWPGTRPWALFVLGSPVVVALASLLVIGVFREPSPFLRAFDQALRETRGSAALVVFLALVVVAPLAEELFFRGYIQGRLERRVPAWLAIVISALAFALIHGEVQHIVGVLPFGLWAAYVAWRTQSVITAIGCHALNNTLAVISSRISTSGSNYEFGDPGAVLTLVVGTAALIPFVAALRSQPRP